MKKPNKKGELKMEDEMDKDDDDFEFSDELKTKIKLLFINKFICSRRFFFLFQPPNGTTFVVVHH